jgi:hypothetical protein
MYAEDKERYSISKEENGNSKKVTVKEIENGYLVCIREEGYKGEGDKKEWYCEEKEFYSKTNPLIDDSKEEKEEETEKESVLSKLPDFMNSLASSLGKLNI